MLNRLSPAPSNSELRALIDAIERLPPGARERGSAYALQGRALVQDVGDAYVGGVVRGNAAYRTNWSRGPRGWVSQCSCPLGGACKHAYALAHALLEARSADDEFTDPRLASILPEPTNGSAAAHGRAGSNGDDDSALGRLRRARLEWERQSALDEILVDAPVLGLNPYTPPLSLTLLEPDPDLLCWQLARTIAGLADGWLPAALEPYRERPDLAEGYLARERTALGAELIRWAERRPGDARRQLRLLFELIARGTDAWALAFEVRVTTPRLADAPRTAVQLQQLRTELLRAPDLFPGPQQELIEWLADHATTAFGVEPYSPTRLTTAMPLSLLERVTESGVAIWADQLPEVVIARGGIAPGQPVRLSPQAARMVPDCIESDGDLRIELRLRWSDEHVRGLDDVVLLAGPAGAGRRSSLVLADGVFSPLADEPPAALRQRFRSVGSLPIPAQERGPFVAALAARFPHLRGTLAAHTRVRPAAPSVTIDLRTDDWLQVRVFAHSGGGAWYPGAMPSDGAVLFEYTFERGWERCTFDKAGQALPIVAATAAGPPAAAAPAESGRVLSDAELWIESPAFESVEPALHWMEFLPLGPGNRLNGDGAPAERVRALGWWMRASRRNMEMLAAAWEKRPPEVAFFGSDQARRLLGGGRTAAPRLRVAASGVDWLTLSAEWDAEGKRLTAADLAKLRAATTKFVRLESGWVAADSIEDQDEIGRALADLGVNPDGGEQRLTVWQLAGASETTLQTLERMGGDRETLATLARVRSQVAAFSGLPNVPLPPGLTADLRPYQRQGLDFLANASSLGLGAVLADDMGLGKTVQALAWLLHLRQQEPGSGPALVVCPASVVHNWAREAARFAPDLRVLLLTGGKLRHALREEIPQHDLLVTTYALLRRDLDAWREAPLHVAILDEAQFIKNPDAAVTRAARALDAKHRLALTGTPLENRALDLWSILSFATPGYLGGRAEFTANYDSAEAPPHARMLLAAKLRPLLLRRSKQAVAPELPPRIEERVDCELSKAQRQLYVTELQRSRQLLAQVAREPGGVAGNKLSILSALTRLRQICCHPLLGGGRAGLESGKFDALFEMLEPLLAEGHKVLVFSQFVQCLKLLAAEMKERGIAFHTLTGATVKRERVVTAFQEDTRPCVFLISLKAGGTGLNLTSASYVVLFDPWWNPAVEAQAIDRTHRIGQENTVIAYRMLARGTIEEKIWELQQRKAALVREVLGEGGFARALTRDDLEYLFADVG